MADRGGEWTEITDDAGNAIESFWWKRCEVAGCPNNICRNLSPIFCWPHADGGASLTELINKVNARAPVDAMLNEAGAK